jgi:hypothetical protein
MKNSQPTIQDIHLICATAMVAMPTARKYFHKDRPMRPAMVQRIESALRTLDKQHLLRRSQQKRRSVAS